MEIEFLKLASGRSPVGDYIRSVGDDQMRQRIMDRLELFEGCPIENLLRSGELEKIANRLYELKIPKKGKNIHRFLCTRHREELWLLHAFQKKGQKIPQKEIDIAKQRLTYLPTI